MELLNGDSDSAGPNDLIIAVRADNETAATEGIKEAEKLLDAPAEWGGSTNEWYRKRWRRRCNSFRAPTSC